MQNSSKRKALAKRSLTRPILFLIIGAAFLGGATYYAAQLSITSEKAFMLTFMIVYYAIAALLIGGSVFALAKRRVAVESDETGVYLYFGGRKKPPVAIPFAELTDCRMKRTVAQNGGVPAAKMPPLYAAFTFGTLYLYTQEKTYSIANIARVYDACLAIREEAKKHNEKAQ